MIDEAKLKYWLDKVKVHCEEEISKLEYKRQIDKRAHYEYIQLIALGQFSNSINELIDSGEFNVDIESHEPVKTNRKIHILDDLEAG